MATREARRRAIKEAARIMRGGREPMSDEIKLASVEHEYKRWDVRIQWPVEVVGLSAGTWALTGPNRVSTFGMTVRAPAPEHFRQMAAAFVEAAELIEHDIANPSEPVEDLYRETPHA